MILRLFNASIISIWIIWNFLFYLSLLFIKRSILKVITLISIYQMAPGSFHKIYYQLLVFSYLIQYHKEYYDLYNFKHFSLLMELAMYNYFFEICLTLSIQNSFLFKSYSNVCETSLQHCYRISYLDSYHAGSLLNFVEKMLICAY